MSKFLNNIFNFPNFLLSDLKVTKQQNWFSFILLFIVKNLKLPKIFNTKVETTFRKGNIVTY